MLWTVALLPAVSAAALMALPDNRGLLTVAACFVQAATLALVVLAVAGDWTAALDWSAALRLQAGLTPLSATVALLVPVIALPVTGYAGANTPAGIRRMLALLLLFVGAMELLVIAADLLTLLIGWELVGACSWALIAHHWRDRDGPAAARYAFVTTRLGDLGLFLAAMTAFAGTGSFAYADLEQLDRVALNLLVAGVLLSAAAKSGQVPFAPWLFRAMAGPAPVSALLHAATMVAAGAYLLIRLQPVLDGVPWFGPAAIGIGLITALSGGVVALLQPHAKKLLAASTSAQYGLMFVAVGAGYPAVAALHLVAHACFKALLFLAAGIAGDRAGSYLLVRMQLGRSLPIAAALSALGALALAGVPPLGAAWTKEVVTAAAGHAAPWLGGAVIVAGGLSAAYAVRFQWLAYGPGDGAGDNGADGLTWETAALGLLALTTLLLSLLWWPPFKASIAGLLQTVPPRSKSWEMAASLLALGAGLYAGRLLAGRYAALGNGEPAAALAAWLGLPGLIEKLVVRPSQSLAQTAWRLDDHCLDALPRGAAALGGGLAVAWGRFGELVTDGLPEGSARLAALGGNDVRRLQTGLSHHYYALIAVAVLLLAGILAVASYALP